MSLNFDFDFDFEGEGEALRRLAPSGFYVGLHIWFTSPLIVLESYPRAWIDHYSEQVYALRHPTVA